MNTSGDYLTVLQLGVALNLVVGAYTTARVDFEQQAAYELDVCQEKLATFMKGEPEGPLEDNLHRKPIKDLTKRELYRYVTDITVRLDDRVRNYSRLDGKIDNALLLTGFACVVALIWASVNPLLHVPRGIGIFASIASLAVPLLAFTKTNLELKAHRRFYRRPPNDSFVKKVQDRNKERSHSDGSPGEIFKVTNRVRGLS